MRSREARQLEGYFKEKVKIKALKQEIEAEAQNKDAFEWQNTELEKI